MVIVQGQAECQIVEAQPNLFAMVTLGATVANRGWPAGDGPLQLIRAESSAPLSAFRTVVSDLLTLASQRPEDLAALREMEIGLLSSLDWIVQASAPLRPFIHYREYLRIVEKIDKYQKLYPDGNTRCDHLADYCDVSPARSDTL